jgi:hypothetical protein
MLHADHELEQISTVLEDGGRSDLATRVRDIDHGLDEGYSALITSTPDLTLAHRKLAHFRNELARLAPGQSLDGDAVAAFVPEPSTLGSSLGIAGITAAVAGASGIVLWKANDLYTHPRPVEDEGRNPGQ